MTIFYLLTCIVCGSYTVIMVAYVIGWKRTPVFQGARDKGQGTRVTIVLPVRNEESNIQSILGCLSKQDYPKDLYEIIVVDDFSDDSTSERIHAAALPNLKYIRLKKGGGKKQAITEGIDNASGMLIVTTDADCEMGPKWLSGIVEFYGSSGSKMIVSPVLLKGERSFSEIVQSQEMTVLTAVAGAALYYDTPVLCSGANLAYERAAFHSVKGFEGVDRTATGDDVFLMLKFHKQYPGEIRYLKSKEASVFTIPAPKSFLALKQRKRWASKTFAYAFSYITGIAIVIFLMNFLVLLSGILSIINVKFAYALILTLPLKCIVDFMLLKSASSFFSKRVHSMTFFMASLLYPVYVTVIGLIAPFTHYTWKGRQS